MTIVNHKSSSSLHLRKLFPLIHIHRRRWLRLRLFELEVDLPGHNECLAQEGKVSVTPITVQVVLSIGEVLGIIPVIVLNN